MELIPAISAGLTFLSVTIGLVAFILAQARWTREVIEKGDTAVREADSKARHDIANNVQRVTDDIRRDVEALKKEGYRRDEAKDMESRLAGAVSKVEGRLDHISDRLGKLPAIEQQITSLGMQFDKLFARLDARGGHGD